MTEPTPVLPLDYSNRSQESWLPMIRFMATAAVFFAMISIVGYLWVLGLFVAQQITTGPTAPTFGFTSTVQLLVELPLEIATATIMIGGILAMRLHSGGRKALIVGAAAYVICSGLYGAWSTEYTRTAVSAARINTPYRLYLDTYALSSEVQHCFLPVLLWLFFRKTAVREALDFVGHG